MTLNLKINDDLAKDLTEISEKTETPIERLCIELLKDMVESVFDDAALVGLPSDTFFEDGAPRDFPSESLSSLLTKLEADGVPRELLSR
jgi:hypothetical protein